MEELATTGATRFVCAARPPQEPPEENASPAQRGPRRKSEATALRVRSGLFIYIRHRLCSPPQADLPEAYLKIGPAAGRLEEDAPAFQVGLSGETGVAGLRDIYCSKSKGGRQP